jgi:hypothetical protein
VPQDFLAAAQELTGKIEETGKRTLEAAEARLAAEGRERAQQIETAKKRVETAVRAEFSSQIQVLIDRSRERSDRLKARFTALDEALSHLGKKHDQAHRHITHSLERSHGDLRNQIAALLQANEALRVRVAEWAVRAGPRLNCHKCSQRPSRALGSRHGNTSGDAAKSVFKKPPQI